MGQIHPISTCNSDSDLHGHVHCMIETRTVFNPARSLIHHCFTHVIHRSFRTQVAPASHRSVCSWCLRPLHSTTSPPGLTDLGGTIPRWHSRIAGAGRDHPDNRYYSILLAVLLLLGSQL